MTSEFNMSTLDLRDEIDKKLSQAQSICQLMKLYESRSDEVRDGTPEHAMWCVSDLLDDVERAVERLACAGEGAKAPAPDVAGR